MDLVLSFRAVLLSFRAQSRPELARDGTNRWQNLPAKKKKNIFVFYTTSENFFRFLYSSGRITYIIAARLSAPSEGRAFFTVKGADSLTSKTIVMTKSLSPLEESAGRYACLLYDSTVKTVLGVQENEDLLIEILQFLIPGKRISSITVGNKEKHGLVVSEKVVIFDLLCRDADTGEEFLVEVQNAPDKTFKDRALYSELQPRTRISRGIGGRLCLQIRAA